MFGYTLVRTRRKSVSIVVDRDASLVVRAPLRFPVSRIEEFLQSNREWIDRTVKQRLEVQAHFPERRYINGENFFYLGESYPLRLVDYAEKTLSFEKGVFQLLRHSKWRAKNVFAEWYRREAETFLSGTIRRIASERGIQYGCVRTRDMRSRWGSCSAIGDISLNSRLILAPPQMAEYVAAHELAHISYRDHSADFWKETERLCKHFRESRLWLRENGHTLVWE